jgi:hypothetical protein
VAGIKQGEQGRTIRAWALRHAASELKSIYEVNSAKNPAPESSLKKKDAAVELWLAYTFFSDNFICPVIYPQSVAVRQGFLTLHRYEAR